MTANTDPGLCATCKHARSLTSDRGSIFWQCQRSFTDPSFPKYPRLPVRQCSGYERIEPSRAGDKKPR